MQWNRYLLARQAGLLVGLIYFFINTVGLPLGLTYTTLLAPLFYIWVILKRKTDILLPFMGLLLPFIVAHILLVDVEIQKYAIAIFNILAVYIFGQAFYTWLRFDAGKEQVFRKVLLINTVLCLIAIVSYFTPLSYIFWIQQNLTDKVDQFLRLKLFTYEASYYAMLFTPLFSFYFLRYVLRLNRGNSAVLLFMLFMPFVLSFSIGVILCLVAGGLFTFLVHFRSLHSKRRVVNGFVTFGFVTVTLFVLGFIFFRNNPVFLRLENIFLGKDTSTMGRTEEAFILAKKLLEEKSWYWGIGPGQLSLTGADIIRSYYLYSFHTPVAIPNAAAETLALFGWIGFIVRLLVQVVLFFVTKVWTNYYRLLLFFFIFLYQFMGSYITNAAEYVIWILAFTNAFPEFNVTRKNKEVLK
ncbi:MAG: hypothetical protein ABL876_04250 [Chitinophagaceae bacterium]